MESIDHALDTYCRHVMTEMGADTTSTSALDHYGRTHFPGGFFAGVYPADREPPPPTGTDFYIQNTEPASHPGTHWVAIARVPGYPDLLFDSFARKPSHVFLPHLMGRVESTEDDVDQHPRDSTHCGQLCHAFGHVLHRHGRDAATKC